MIGGYIGEGYGKCTEDDLRELRKLAIASTTFCKSLVLILCLLILCLLIPRVRNSFKNGVREFKSFGFKDFRL